MVAGSSGRMVYGRDLVTVFPAVEIVEHDGRMGLDVSSRYGDEFQEALRKSKKKFMKVVMMAPEAPATEKQNRLFHGLLGLRFKARLHSFGSYDEMRNSVKYRYGVCHYYEITKDGKYQTWVKSFTPRTPGTEVVESGTALVSWSDYNRKARTQTIKGLIAEMEEEGILSSSFATEYLEIINGVNHD